MKARGFRVLFAFALAGSACRGAQVQLPEAQDLSFHDFFKLPVGPFGLEPTDRLLSLSEQQVRVRGHLVREEEPFAGLFLLTQMPASLAERTDGPADHLPPATL